MLHFLIYQVAPIKIKEDGCGWLKGLSSPLELELQCERCGVGMREGWDFPQVGKIR